MQCLLCKSATWPQGQVFEISRWRIDSARHFVTQHCDSQKHQRHLGMTKFGEIQVEQVDCQGLCVTDEERGCNLYRFREEFRLWAVHSNFEGSAKHSYYLDKNKDTWFVRSSHCLGKVEKSHMDYHTCDKCLELGSSHGVTRIFDMFSCLFHSIPILKALGGRCFQRLP